MPAVGSALPEDLWVAGFPGDTTNCPLNPSPATPSHDWLRCPPRSHLAGLCRADLQQQLQLPACSLAPRGIAGPRSGAALHGAGHHRRMLSERRCAGSPRSHSAGPAFADRQRLHTASACRPVDGGAARFRPTSGDAGHVAPRLRQSGAVDRRLPAPRTQGRVPRRDGRPGRPCAHRAHARRPAGLPGLAGGLVCTAAVRRRCHQRRHGTPCRAVRGPLRPCAMAEDLVRRSRRTGAATADASARRAPGRDHRARGCAHRPAHRRHRRRAHARAFAQAAAGCAHRHASAQHGGGLRPCAGAQRRGTPAFAPAAGALVPA